MKHKLFFKTLASMLLAFCCVVNVWGTEVTFTFNTDAGLSELGITKANANSGTSLSTEDAYVLNGVSMLATTGPDYEKNNQTQHVTATRAWTAQNSGATDLRIYSTSSLTFSVASGNITSIALAGTTVNVFTVNDVALTSEAATSAEWTGSSSSVELYCTGTGKINTITVTVSSGGGGGGSTYTDYITECVPDVCSSFSFHYNDGSAWQKDCFTQDGSNRNWFSSSFVVPTTTNQFNVCYQEKFACSSSCEIAKLNNEGAVSETVAFKYMPVAYLQENSAAGEGDNLRHAMVGASGKVRIYDNSNANNLYAAFIPDGYILRMGTNNGSDWTSTSFSSQNATNVTMETDIVTIGSGDAGKNIYVAIQTQEEFSASDAGASINNWTNGYALTNCKVSNGNASQYSSWGTISSLTEDKKGKFRFWYNNGNYNGNLHFVPYYNIRYYNEAGTEEITAVATTLVSCEDTEANRTQNVQFTNHPSKTNCKFIGWTTTQGGTTATYTSAGTKTITLTGNVKLYPVFASVSSVEISGTATSKTYSDGDTFNPAGLVVTAKYSDGSSETVTSSAEWSYDPATLTEGNTSVSVKATYGGVQSAAFVVTGLTVNGDPSKKTVTIGVKAGQSTWGTVSMSDEDSNKKTSPAKFSENDYVWIEAEAKTGYAFVRWELNAETDAEFAEYDSYQYTKDMETSLIKVKTKDVTITAVFAEDRAFTVTYNAGAGTCKASDTEASAGAGITLATPTIADDDWKFYGWSETNVASTTDAPTLVTLTDGRYYPSADIPLYAVWKKGGETWTKTAASDVNEAGTYAIITSGGKAFTGSISSGHGSVTETAFSFTQVPGTNPAVFTAESAPTGTMEITLVVSGSGYTMYNSSEGYLYAKDAKSGNLAWHSTESSYWSYASSNWKYASNSAFLRDNTSDIRTYGQNNGTGVVYFAKKTVTTATYATSPSIEQTPEIAFEESTVPSPFYVGETYTRTATATGSTGAISYKSSNTNVATVNASTGLVTAKVAGNATITATVAAVAGSWKENSTTYNISVSAKPQVGNITFSPNGGSIAKGNTVTLTCATEGATMYYTLDGTTPTSSSTEYTAPVAINSSCTMKVLATYDRYTDKTASATFTVVLPEQVMAWTAEGPFAFRLNSEDYNNFTAPTANRTTGDGAVTYSTSDASIAQVNETTGAVTLQGKNGTVTITATAAATSNYQQKQISYTINIMRAGVTRTGNFVLVTNINQLKDGDYVLMTSKTNSGTPDYAEVFAGVSSSQGAHQSKTVADNEITYSQLTADGNTAKILTLGEETIGGTKYYNFNYGEIKDAYIGAGSNTTAGLSENTTLTDISRWTISITDSVATVVNKTNDKYHTLSYAITGAGFFKAYTAQQPGSLRIYVQRDNQLTEQSISFGTASYNLIKGTSEYTNFTRQAVSGAHTTVTYTSSDESVATVASNGTVTLKGVVGSTTITATAAETSTYKSATATYTITVSANKCTVTFKSHGQTDVVLKEASAQAGVTVPANPAAIGDYSFYGWSKTNVTVETYNAPTFIAETAGQTYHPEDDVTLYAVFMQNKSADVPGMLLKTDIGGGTYKYVGANATLNSTTSLAGADAATNALPLWFENGYLYFLDSNTPVYVYYNGDKFVAHKSGHKDDAHTSYPWALTIENGKYIFATNNSRYLAYDATTNHYFRAYVNTYPHEFVVEESSVVHTHNVNHYISCPSSAVAISAAFTAQTPSVEVLGNYQNTLSVTKVNGGAVVNDYGTVTYTSSDEAVATVAADGTVTTKKGGTVTITANIAAVADKYMATSTSYTLTITKKTPTVAFDLAQTSKTIYKENSFTFTMNTTSDATPYISASNSDVTIEGNVVTVKRNTSANSCNITPKVDATDIYAAASGTKINISFGDNKKTQTLTFAAPTAIEYDFDAEHSENFTKTVTGAKTTVTYTSDQTWAVVNASTGAVTVNKNTTGTATITATAAEALIEEGGVKYRYLSASASYTITVSYARPTFSPAAGEIKAPTQVTITPAEAGQAIRYNINGYSDPDETIGYDYSTPLAIGAKNDGTTEYVVKAVAIKDGLMSPVATATYTKVLPSVTYNLVNGNEVHLSCPEDAVLTYFITDENSNILKESTSTPEHEVVYTITQGVGRYYVMASATWNVENGYEYELEEKTIEINGIPNLPIYHTGNAQNLPIYWTKSGSVGNYNASTYPNTQLKFSNTGDAIYVSFNNTEKIVVSYNIMATEWNAGNSFIVEHAYGNATDEGSAISWNTYKEYTGEGALTTTEIVEEIPSGNKTGIHHIRFRYKTREAGSVALGNIAIEVLGAKREQHIEFSESTYRVHKNQGGWVADYPKVIGAKTALTYKSSNTKIAEVNYSTGEVTPYAQEGQTVITATAESNALYNSAQTSYVLTVANYYSVAKGTVSGTGDFTIDVLDSDEDAWACAEDVIKVTPAPASGWGFSTSTGISVAPSASVEWSDEQGAWLVTGISANTTIGVTFTQVTNHTITCAEAANGSITTDPTSAYKGQRVHVIATPATGYVLEYYTISGYAEQFTDEYFDMPNRDITLTPTFSPMPTYTVTFSYSEAMCTNSMTQSVAGEALSLPTPVLPDGCINDNYAFSHWATSPGSEEAVAMSYVPTKNITLYAVYKQATFSDPEQPEAKAWKRTRNITSGEEYIIGYGQECLGNASVSYNPRATSMTVSYGKITSAVTDAMKWTVTAVEGGYSITNGSTFLSVGAKTVDGVTSYNLNINNKNYEKWHLSRVGDYTFSLQDVTYSKYLKDVSSIWQPAEGAQGLTFYSYQLDAEFTYTSDLTPCAQKYYLRYAGYGYGTSCEGIECAAGSTPVIWATAPTKTGYTFAGWRSSADGLLYQPGATLPAMHEDVVLTAEWSLNLVVTYHIDGQEDHIVNVEHAGDNTPAFTASCSNGKTFVGWSVAPVATIQQTKPAIASEDGVFENVQGPIEVWAVFASRNGGKETGTTTISENFETMESSTSNSNKNYSHNGILWTTTNGTVASPSSFTKMLRCMPTSTSNTRYIYTSGIADVKSVTFKAMKTYGSINADVAIATKADFSDAVTQSLTISGNNSLCNQSYSLTKHNVDGTGKNVYLAISAYTSTDFTKYLYIDDVEFTVATRDYFYTDYSTSCELPASATLTYDSNGDEEVASVNTPGWVTLPSTTKSCYTFQGWRVVDVEGHTHIYAAGEKFLFNHDVTLEGVWAEDNTKKAATITFHTGYGNTVQQDVYCHTDRVNVPAVSPSCAAGSGYTFVGWSQTEITAAEGVDEVTLFNVEERLTQIINNGKNIDLYPVWQNGNYTGSDYSAGATGKYVIAATYGGNWYALGNDPAINNGSISGTQIAVQTSGGVTFVTESQAAGFTWTISNSATAGYGQRFYDGVKYLYATGGGLTNSSSLNTGKTGDKIATFGWNITKPSKLNIAATSTTEVSGRGLGFKTADLAFVQTDLSNVNNSGTTYVEVRLLPIFKIEGKYFNTPACPSIVTTTGVAGMVSKPGTAVTFTGRLNIEQMYGPALAAEVTGDDASKFAVNIGAIKTEGENRYADYTVAYTPAAYGETATATVTFDDGSGNTLVVDGGAKTQITVKGSAPAQYFVIAAKIGDEYLALPENTDNAKEMDPVRIDYVDGIGVINAADNLKYTINGVTAAGTATLSLNSHTAQLGGNDSGVRSAASQNASYYKWLVTYDAANGTYRMALPEVKKDDEVLMLAYNNTSSVRKFKPYKTTTATASPYFCDLYLLPIANETGDKMDIVDWTASSVTLNMNGYSSNLGAWSVETNSVSKNKDDRNTDRTLTMNRAAAAADSYIEIKTYGGSPATLDGDRYYKVPHIITSNTTLAGTNAGSNIYVKSGVLTVAASTKVNEIIINEGAELVIANGVTLTCEKLVLRTEPWSAAILTNKGTLTCSKVFYTRRGQKGQKFQQFALPYESQIADVRLSNGVNPAYASTYTLRWYDGESRATNGVANESTTYQNWKTLTLTDGRATIAAHTGYTMVVSNGYYREFYFPITLTNNTEVSVAAHTSSNPKNANWNFICSPLASKATLDQAGDPADYMKICEMVDDDGIYWQHVPSTIYPAVPFYYQAPVVKTLNFSAVVPASVAARAVANTVRTQWLQVVYENEAGVADETNIYLNSERFTADYDMGYDEAKMISTSTRPQIYTQLACGDLAFAAVPDSLMLTPVPLAVYSPAAGEYTFSLAENEWLDRLESVMLTDTETGAMINLLESTYTAAVPAGTTTGRFFLNATFKAPGIATEVDNAQCTMHNGERAEKFLWHDHIYIRKGAHVYDVNGKEVQLFNK